METWKQIIRCQAERIASQLCFCPGRFRAWWQTESQKSDVCRRPIWMSTVSSIYRNTIVQLLWVFPSREDRLCIWLLRQVMVLARSVEKTDEWSLNSKIPSERLTIRRSVSANVSSVPLMEPSGRWWCSSHTRTPPSLSWPAVLINTTQSEGWERWF